MQTTFNQKDWKARKDFLGHTSEQAFEQYCIKEGIRFERFGQKHESTLDYNLIDLYIRTRPDYICQHEGKAFFVEVKGVGRDGILKIKLENIVSLPYWSTLMPVKVFVYDSSRKKCSLFPFTSLKQKLTRLDPRRFENDSKLYFPVSINEFSWRG